MLSLSFALVGIGLVGPVFGGCGGVMTDPGTDATCALTPPGKTFTFHVHNLGMQKLKLAFGCGLTLPLAIETGDGPLRAGPGVGNGSQCEYTCEQIYSSTGMDPCTDCGAGVGVDLSPGAVADIVWDRRVYVDTKIDPKCVTNGATECPKGTLVAPIAKQKGVLTVCSDVQSTPLGGDCLEGSSIPFNFEADTSGDETTINYP